MKIYEVENEILSITNLATAPALTAFENQVPNASDLVKKANYDAEIKAIKNKYFTTPEKVTNNVLDEKTSTKKFVNESGLNEKIKTTATNK